MQRNPHDEAGQWFLQAERDLDDAEFTADGGRHHLSCFLSQQSAEKALRAFIYSKGVERVWSHSVAELARSAVELSSANTQWRESFEELRVRCAPLDKYYIPTRYPNGLPGGIPSEAFSADDSQLALAMARFAIDRVRERLEKP